MLNNYILLFQPVPPTLPAPWGSRAVSAAASSRRAWPAAKGAVGSARRSRAPETELTGVSPVLGFLKTGCNSLFVVFS